MDNLNKLIFGKDDTINIVGSEVQDGWIELFLEYPDRVESKFIPNKYWLLSSDPMGPATLKLEGNLHYKYGRQFDKLIDLYKTKKQVKDPFYISDPKESAMVNKGFTYYKGMKLNDVSVLSFDIETTGLVHNASSKVLLISNTFRKNGQVTRKLFAYDDYQDDASFFDAWCQWVREVNPSIVLGHNIFMYDLPYMKFCADRAETSLKLGRNDSDIVFSKYDSKFRFDGSQDYDYKRCYIYGREIVDTMFLSMKYDFSRKYESYRLKQIIKQENLEVVNRQFYDAGTIYQNYTNPEEWEKIKKYAIHDADDALALFDLMSPSYFYYTQSIPKPFQSVMYSASGSQINSFLIRSYLQEKHSLPLASVTERFEGAISLGNPGIYKNVYKVDIASLYPSIMLEYEIYNKVKDPNANFFRMVKYFTEERLRNKKLGKDTGDRYYKDMEQAQKIVINSAYGMMGAQGLLFNSPTDATFVTTKGREILQAAINWAEYYGYKIVNADTDSISITKNGEEINEDQRKDILKELNDQFPDMIHFEDDGYFPAVLVLRIKNYVLFDGKKKKIKGSALKSSKIEIALKEFMGKTVDNLLNNDVQSVLKDYKEYVKEIHDIKDIKRWCGRKTITEKVLEGARTTEQKILDAVGDDTVQMGDKIHTYFDNDNNLKQEKHWTGDHNKAKMYEKLYKTVKIFDNVLDVKLFTNFKLKNKKVQALLQEVLNETEILRVGQTTE